MAARTTGEVELAKRIDRIERENRTMKLLLGALGGLVGFVLLAGAARSAPSQPAATVECQRLRANVIEAQALVLVDDQGRSYGALGIREGSGASMLLWAPPLKPEDSQKIWNGTCLTMPSEAGKRGHGAIVLQTGVGQAGLEVIGGGIRQFNLGLKALLEEALVKLSDTKPNSDEFRPRVELGIVGPGVRSASHISVLDEKGKHAWQVAQRGEECRVYRRE